MRTNTDLALSGIAKIKPWDFETRQDKRKDLNERLDTLESSLKFYQDNYKGLEKEHFLEQINEEIELVNQKLSLIPESKTITQLMKEGDEGVEDSIMLILNDLRFFFMVDNMITDRGLQSTTMLIISSYGSLTLEEVAMCMQQAKSGEFGQLFNRLDGAIIIGWLKTYTTQKMERLKEKHQVAQAQSKVGVNPYRSAEVVSISDKLNEAYAAIELERVKK